MGIVMQRSVGDGPASDWCEPFWNQRRSSFRQGRDVVLVRDVAGNLVGFSAFQLRRLGSHRCCYMGSGYVIPDLQGQRIGYALSARMFWSAMRHFRGRRFFMASDVMNPIVLAGWRRRTPADRFLFPPLGDTPPNRGLLEVAGHLLDEFAVEFEVDRAHGVVRGRSAPRSPEIPTTGDAKVDSYFADHFGASSGDTVLMVVDVRWRSLVPAARHLATSLGVVAARRLRAGPEAS
jgi:hypothetical protein